MSDHFEETLQKIAGQKTSEELLKEYGYEEWEGGDYEYGYNKLIEIAREALNQPKQRFVPQNKIGSGL